MPEGRLATQVFPGQPKPGPDDLQATWQGQWDSRFLYLHLSVDDANRRTVEASKPTQFWQGDGVSFEFGPDVSTLPPSTKPRSGKDFHVMVGVTPLGGLASFNMANAGAIRAGGALSDVILSRTDRPGGYDVEMAVPWTDVGLSDATRPRIAVGDERQRQRRGQLDDDVEARPHDQQQPGAHGHQPGPSRHLAAPRPR